MSPARNRVSRVLHGRLLVAVFLLVAAFDLAGQEIVTSAEPRGEVRASATFGGTDLGIVSVSGRVFDSWWFGDYAWDGGRYMTENAAGLVAPLVLPNGVRLERVEMDACDVSAKGYAWISLTECPSDVVAVGFCTQIGDVSTGEAQTPGCATFSLELLEPVPVVDNSANSYMFTFLNTIFDGTAKLRAARVYYRRQVSPAPEFASFGDVPVGHPLHQFVQALAASGITAGCGGGNFCPNDTVTRGQMAVFLAKALGLHWAN